MLNVPIFRTPSKERESTVTQSVVSRGCFMTLFLSEVPEDHTTEHAALIAPLSVVLVDATPCALRDTHTKKENNVMAEILQTPPAMFLRRSTRLWVDEHKLCDATWCPEDFRKRVNGAIFGVGPGFCRLPESDSFHLFNINAVHTLQRGVG